jgi:hypothetical protein
LLDVVHPQLEVLLPWHPSVQLKEGVVIVNLALFILFRKAHIDDLVGACGGELTCYARIEDDVRIVDLRVDVVSRCEDKVRSNEESGSCGGLPRVIEKAQIADAVVRELLYLSSS